MPGNTEWNQVTNLEEKTRVHYGKEHRVERAYGLRGLRKEQVRGSCPPATCVLGIQMGGSGAPAG